jgi:hypothetical protein
MRQIVKKFQNQVLHCKITKGYNAGVRNHDLKSVNNQRYIRKKKRSCAIVPCGVEPELQRLAARTNYTYSNSENITKVPFWFIVDGLFHSI